MRYPEVYRERTVEYLEAGHTYEETSKVFKVSKKTILQWKKRKAETGAIKDRRRKPAPFRKIDPDKFRAYVDAHPDAYQEEMAVEFGCSRTAVQKALKRLGYTRKKNDTLQGAGQGKGGGVQQADGKT